MAPTASGVAFMVSQLRGRWFMLYGSFLIMSAAGATSIFAVYSKDIKARLGYTQEELNTVGFIMDLGANVGVHAGLIAEVAPPWLVLSISAFMNLGGYLMLYLSVSGRVGSETPVWLACLYIFIGANSQTFSHTCALVSSVRSFPGSRGAMLGLLKGFLGLSGAIFTQLYLAFYGGRSGADTRSLILLIGWLPAIVSVAFLGTIRVIPATKQAASAFREFRAVRCLLYLSLVLAAYLMVAIILQKRFSFNSTEYGVSTGIILTMLLVPLAIVQREEAAAALIHETSDMALAETSVVDVATEPTPQPEASTSTAMKNPASTMVRTLRSLRPRPPPRGQDHTILQALVSVDMLLLLTASAVGVGGMLTAVYNIGQIGESLGYPQQNITNLVSLVSIWSYLGRVTSGFGLDTALVRHNLSTPLLMFVVLLLAVPGHLLVAFGVPGSLYPASMVIGFCYGATQPLVLAIISELFGLKYYSTLSNFGPTVCPLGTYILNVRVAGRMYDMEAARQSVVGGGHVMAGKVTTCIGVRCYRESFLVIAVATSVAAAVVATLTWRTWEFYAVVKNRKEQSGDGRQGVSCVAGEANQHTFLL
ncbi:hypothetical protein HU200_048054 [Digitaria exilis]|uniref:Nodulin-like domain-containing protein n=1 Tax=Digitaria exilis TaxID=1010633 RepID=A0A835ECE3_9POAL|nr:hypothetical protein HU200_048054 [Digitaria exilis]